MIIINYYWDLRAFPHDCCCSWIWFAWAPWEPFPAQNCECSAEGAKHTENVPRIDQGTASSLDGHTCNRASNPFRDSRAVAVLLARGAICQTQVDARLDFWHSADRSTNHQAEVGLLEGHFSSVPMRIQQETRFWASCGVRLGPLGLIVCARLTPIDWSDDVTGGAKQNNHTL